MTIRKSTVVSIAGLTLAASSGVAFAQDDSQTSNMDAKQGAADGIYSAEQLLDAEVYAQGNSDESIGEVEDLIFGNSMTIQSFIVQSENDFGLAGKSYVVQPGQLTVESMTDGDEDAEPEYRVMLNVDSEGLAQYPVYSDSWWNQTQEQAQNLWMQTKETASSAWTSVTAGASNLADNTEQAANDAAEATGNAAGDAAQATENAAENTGDAVSNAADATGDAASNAAEETGDAAENATDSMEDATN